MRDGRVESGPFHENRRRFLSTVGALSGGLAIAMESRLGAQRRPCAWPAASR